MKAAGGALVGIGTRNGTKMGPEAGNCMAMADVGSADIAAIEAGRLKYGKGIACVGASCTCSAV